MTRFTVLLHHPNFAPLFARVHPLFWVILWWQIERLLAHCQRENIPDALTSVSPFGILTVHYFSQSASAYRPPEPTRASWDDPAWASAMPANLAALPAFILPCASGGGGIQQSGQSEGVRQISDCMAIARRTISITPNTS